MYQDLSKEEQKQNKENMPANDDNLPEDEKQRLVKYRKNVIKCGKTEPLPK